VGALADSGVSQYLEARFVASYQKVGTFTVAGKAKQGGNVAAYFCTPDGAVLHAVAGPVKAGVFLREARWAVETWKLARLETADDPIQLRTFLHKAHAERLRAEHGVDLLRPGAGRALNGQGKTHLLMAAAPLAQLRQVYPIVFERILGEKVSTAPVVQKR
jgi:hypothetical protein